MSIHVYAGVGFAKIIAALLLWFIYLDNGNKVDKMLWRAWFSGFIAILGSWGPVVIFYAFQFIGDDWARKGYMWTCMISVDGPFLGYAVPLVFTLIGYLSN